MNPKLYLRSEFIDLWNERGQELHVGDCKFIE